MGKMVRAKISFVKPFAFYGTFGIRAMFHGDDCSMNGRSVGRAFSFLLFFFFSCDARSIRESSSRESHGRLFCPRDTGKEERLVLRQRRLRNAKEGREQDRTLTTNSSASSRRARVVGSGDQRILIRDRKR